MYEEGVEFDPDKVVKVKSWHRPENFEQVREFLGFAGYYRRFVRNFPTNCQTFDTSVGCTQYQKEKETK